MTEPNEETASAGVEPVAPAGGGARGDGPRGHGARGPRLRRIASLAGRGLLLGALASAGVAAGVVYHYSQDLPDVEHLRDGYHPPQSSRVFASDGTLLFTDYLQRRTVVPFAEVPDVTKLAVLGAEDAYFYEHGAVSLRSLMRAAWAIVKAGGELVQGGSTLTMQVAEDVVLGHSRALSQKFREWILAYRLERELTKDEILGLYLNNIYLGHGRFGVDEAARYYFGKRASGLDAAESALLAGIIASPDRYSPRRSPELALRRRAYVLGQMLQKGFITPDLYTELAAAPLKLAPVVEDNASLAPEAVAVARRALSGLRKDGHANERYRIETTIDPRLQAAARSAVVDALSAYAERHRLKPPFVSSTVKAWGEPFQGEPRRYRIYVGVVDSVDDQAGVVRVQVGDVLGEVKLRDEPRYNPKGLLASDFTRPGALLRVRIASDSAHDALPVLRLELGPQAALAAVDVHTRHVLALVGSAEGTVGGFDRSTRARRQPASTFKPFVYGAALHQHEVAAATVLELDRKGPGIEATEPPYRISVRSALAHSNNDAALRLLRMAGPERVVEWAQNAGIQSPLRPDESLALGSYEVTPLELANAYATFASGGVYSEPVIVSAIQDGSGALIGPEATTEARRVMGADEAYLVTSLLQTVVEAGTAEQAKSLGRPVAAKTGTTNDAKDAWLAGYTNDLSVAVWIGYDDALPLGPQESGTRTAGPAFVAFMRAAHEGRPVSDFPRPPGIDRVAIDPETGLLPWPGEPHTVTEEFLDGTAPSINAIDPALLSAAALLER